MTSVEPRPSPAGGRRLEDPDELTALEEQRDFLLRSLDDLEREREAGDVDDHDYASLRDDYTARAAAVLRAIERRNARFAEPAGPKRWPRTLAWAAAALAFAVLAGVLVAQSAGRRDPGQVATGDIRQTVNARLNDAGRLLSAGEYADAIEQYDSVLQDQPSNREAMTYRAWALRLSGERSEGLTAMLDAATVHPDYPDAHAFLAVIFFQEGLVDLAAQELEVLDGLDPPPYIRDLLEPLREEIEAAQGRPR